MMKKAASASEEKIDWGGRAAEGNFRRTLMKNVHEGLPQPLKEPSKCSMIRGDYVYFHYGCDGQDDRGWGCGYRTVQTMSSWICCNFGGAERKAVPSLPEIQQTLVTVGDKPGSFAGSREWIGTVEGSLVLDLLYEVPSKLVHIRGGAELESVAVQELHRHFEKHGSPAMMGGDRDNSSKGILGVCSGEGGSHLLVLDPHYYGSHLEKEDLQGGGWVSWKRVSSLDQTSFYNLCLPQTAKKTP
ncbi:inactive Ufm1-specific protease 1 [Oryzias melastigma]|uniref:UFM1-specific peptidase 1 n=1 Tax=Oryzias melastigma TaxID=30732 RepID=A0A3B3BB33_ORYME|nr:inactive Ufm1-specific protease 1 [Oryzias melastigma]XP_024144470.1 inactive Ufm1-specific protease 1 [Oryzias melastigma]